MSFLPDWATVCSLLSESADESFPWSEEDDDCRFLPGEGRRLVSTTFLRSGTFSIFSPLLSEEEPRPRCLTGDCLTRLLSWSGDDGDLLRFLASVTTILFLSGSGEGENLLLLLAAGKGDGRLLLSMRGEGERLLLLSGEAVGL